MPIPVTMVNLPEDSLMGHRTRAQTLTNHSSRRMGTAMLVTLLVLAGVSNTSDAFVVPRKVTSQSSTKGHPFSSPASTIWEHTPRGNFAFRPSSLGATLQDHASSSSSSEEEEDSNNISSAPRPTRRIDDILEEYEATGDAGLTISILESSLKKEQQKSSTLAVRLAYAEQVIAEQKKRLETKRSSLQQKTQALSETQKKLRELERRLQQNNNNNGRVAPPAQQQQRRPAAPPSTEQQAPWQRQQPPLTTTERQYPLITNWSINKNTGEVTGTVSSHPSIPDGTTIVTSGLNPESFALAGDSFVFDSHKPAAVVTTRSGSMYQLGVKKIRRPAPTPRNPVPFPTAAPKAQQANALNSINPNLEFPLTGQSISNGRGTKYLLAGAPKRKPSGRSEIIMAYKCDDQLRVCDSVTPYVVKLSTHKDKLRREYENYQQVQENPAKSGGGEKANGGFFGGLNNIFDSQPQLGDTPFVTCHDFLPVCEGSIQYAQHSALVLELGHEDLRDYEHRLQQAAADENYPGEVDRVSMGPSLVRSSLLVAARCLRVLHTRARLVWTDLKAENLIFMGEHLLQRNQEQPLVDIKGVDLESAIPHRGNPLDYTPEACPPEFATYHLQGNPYDFTLEYSYDVWSFGMLAYELATGRAYFKHKTPDEIMHLLGDPGFVPPLGEVDLPEHAALIPDARLRDLIRSCLQIDPRKRSSVRRILNHAYFQKQQPPSPPSQQQHSQQQHQQQHYNNNNEYGNSGTFWSAPAAEEEATNPRRNFLAAVTTAALGGMAQPQLAFAADDKKKRYVLDEATGDYVEAPEDQDWQTEWRSRYDQMTTMSRDEIFAAARGAGNVDSKDLANESPASKKRRAFSGCRDRATRARLNNIDEKVCAKRVLDGDYDFVLRVTDPQPSVTTARAASPPVATASSPVAASSSNALDPDEQLAAARQRIATLEARLAQIQKATLDGTEEEELAAAKQRLAQLEDQLARINRAAQ